jgi:hypothetical protein
MKGGACLGMAARISSSVGFSGRVTVRPLKVKVFCLRALMDVVVVFEMKKER